MKKLLLALIACLAMAGKTFASTDSPVDMVRETSKQVLDLLKKDDGKNSRKIREQVETLATPKFDFPRFTAYTIGKNWQTATPEQQATITNLFQNLLTRIYASNMSRFKNAQIDVKPNAVINGPSATVKTEVSLPNSEDKKPIAVDYTLYKSQQGWRVYNVTIEGISMVSTYRNQFDPEIRKNGIPGLIKLLQTKNAALAQGNTQGQ